MTIFNLPVWLWTWALTKQEREIYNLIMALQAKTIWHVPINNFKVAPSYGHALDLFCALKFEATHFPENTKNLIGEELVEKLVNWTL